MEPINLAVCDDNPHDREQICALLRAHLDKNGYVSEIQTFTSGEALLDAFTACPFDAVFLDIYMNGISGMETARKLRELDPSFALVFITTSRDHAIESFALRPNYYLTKPIERMKIEDAFLQCRSTFLKNARFIEVMSERVIIKIPISKILYIETFGRETLFHTTGGTLKTTAHMLLDDLDRTLGDSFLRCHRSYIVNLNHVEAVQPEEFRLRGGSLVPLRRRERSELRNTYANFISDRLFEAPL